MVGRFAGVSVTICRLQKSWLNIVILLHSICDMIPQFVPELWDAVDVPVVLYIYVTSMTRAVSSEVGYLLKASIAAPEIL